MNISPYQEQILEWVKNGTGHATCNAVAASGKSTTLQLAANTLTESGISPRQIKILVFGKANADELIHKFGSQWKDSIGTMHSIGWLMLKADLNIGSKGKIEGNKYQSIAYKMGFFGFNSLKKAKVLENDQDLIQLVNLLRCTNTAPTTISVLAVSLAAYYSAYPSEIRKLIYTTNAIESMNSSLRKVIKSQQVFPTDEAAFKLVYLAMRNISKKWTMPIKDWKPALNRFAIEFEGRLHA